MCNCLNYQLVVAQVINHLMYADDIVLVAPSAKGMQRLIDVAYNYGCQYDIIFNSSKSQMMVFDTRKIGHTVDFSIGSSTMNETTSYRYLGHIITNNLSDEADIEEKVRSLYVRCNSLLRKFYFCSDKVKNKLFSCYCSKRDTREEGHFEAAFWEHAKTKASRKTLVTKPNRERFNNDGTHTRRQQEYEENNAPCYYCAEPSHKTRDCGFKQPVECWRCQDLGHKAKHCYQFHSH